MGTALALALSRAGYTIAEVVSRDQAAARRKARALAKRVHARATTLSHPQLDAGLIWFCVPDRSIASVARELSSSTEWREKIAFHSSGALPSD